MSQDNGRPQELDKIEEILGIKLPTNSTEEQRADTASDQNKNNTEEDDEEHTYTIDSTASEEGATAPCNYM